MLHYYIISDSLQAAISVRKHDDDYPVKWCLFFLAGIFLSKHIHNLGLHVYLGYSQTNCVRLNQKYNIMQYSHVLQNTWKRRETVNIVRNPNDVCTTAQVMIATLHYALLKWWELSSAMAAVCIR